MTTTTTFQGLDPGSKNSSRVLRPPGGGSNISFGTDEEKPLARKNKMASSIFAEPDDPHAHRRNNPPGGKPSGVLCGEPSAPLRRCQGQPSAQNNSDEVSSGEVDIEKPNAVVVENNTEEQETVKEQKEEAPQGSAATGPGGRRNPPGGKSSLILG